MSKKTSQTTSREFVPGNVYVIRQTNPPVSGTRSGDILGYTPTAEEANAVIAAKAAVGVTVVAIKARRIDPSVL